MPRALTLSYGGRRSPTPLSRMRTLSAVLHPRLGPTAMIVAVLAAGAGCGTPAATAGHGTAAAPVRTDVPEPATAPPVAERPAGRVVALPGGPEGLAADARDGILAV